MQLKCENCGRTSEAKQNLSSVEDVFNMLVRDENMIIFAYLSLFMRTTRPIIFFNFILQDNQALFNFDINFESSRRLSIDVNFEGDSENCKEEMEVSLFERESLRLIAMYMGIAAAP